MESKKVATLTFGDVARIKEAIEREYPNGGKMEIIAAAWEIGYRAALDDLEKERAKEGAAK